MVEKQTKPWQRADPPPSPSETAPEPLPSDEPTPDEASEAAPEPPPEPLPAGASLDEPTAPDDEPLDAEYLDEEAAPNEVAAHDGEAPLGQVGPPPAPSATVARIGTVPQSRVDQLPKRRWLLRTRRAYLRAALGALIGGALPFVAWWLGYLPPRALWLVLIPMALGWFLFLPPSVYLAMDEQGVALIVKEWLRTNYLWIPAERLILLGKDRGWLRAVGTNLEQEGIADWEEVARKAGATKIDSVSQTFGRSNAGGRLIAAPFYMLDELSRDEIELYIFQQCKY